jgi:histidyl-tRNA synthetase
LANQYKIYPIGQLEQVEVNIGVKTKDDFEVIEIMDESNPYPALLGIDWAFDNNAVLNLKKRQMSFETNTLHVVALLDPYEGDRYNESVDEDAQNSAIENKVAKFVSAKKSLGVQKTSFRIYRENIDKLKKIQKYSFFLFLKHLKKP